MPETIGLLILTSAGLTESVTGIGTAALTIEVAGTTVSVASIVGSAAIIGATIGLELALSNSNTPKPENGAQPLKQAVPPRIRGYWINRLGGYYMLFIPAGGNSQDVVAFHQGQIEEILQVYLHDTIVNFDVPPAHATQSVVQVVGAHQFESGHVTMEFWFGHDTQPYSSWMASQTGGIWDSSHQGNGIAYLGMLCTTPADPSIYTRVFPQGLPLPSVVAKCAPIWDPRDPTQSRTDKTTWKARPNPVLQLIDYLTLVDGGMGLDFNTILPPATLAQWIAQANICDAMYSSAGWYQFDNSPENVIGKILATCDGWLAEAGDGTLALQVGYYTAPSDPAITESHVLGLSVKYGHADEDTINQLDVTFTNPNIGYVTDQLDPVRDEAAITLTGVVRSKPLDLSWVQSSEQATRLGKRALLRLNPAMSGTLVTGLYGLRYLGKRWVNLQLPNIPGLENAIVEIQDKANIDLVGGRVTFNWQLVDVNTLITLQPLSLAIKLDFSAVVNSMYLALFEDI